MRFPIYRAALVAAAVLLPFISSPTYLGAQVRGRADEKRDTEARIERLPDGLSIVFGSSNRAVLGVTLAASSRADVDGVRIDEVQADGPAAKAGL
jgi:S1-C subfamily serine protease